MGGGYALKRMTHVVGDSSTGKTQLAIEAVSTFVRQYGVEPIYRMTKKGELLTNEDGSPQRIYQIFYCDAEAAFDPDYAAALGCPIDDIHFVQPSDPGIGITVEDFSDSLHAFIDELPPGVPGIYILDSLDSLPTHKEATTPMSERGGYGTEKSKSLGELFRTVVQKQNYKDVLLWIISQTRDNISGYGPKKIFSGGNAPKFYASQRISLKRVDTLKKTINGKEHIYGVKIMATCEKNKCGPPFGECEFDIIFNGGIDDLKSNIDYLHEVKQFALLPPEITTVGKEMCKQPGVPLDRIKAIEDPQKQKEMIQAVRDAVIAYDKETQKKLEVFRPIGKDI